MRLRPAGYVVACLPILALALAAQSPSTNWDNVRALSSGTEIRIMLSASRSVRGHIQSVTNESLEVNSASGRQTFPRLQVLRVEARKNGHRARNALIGMGIGAGVGLGIGLASNGGFISRSVLTALTASVLGAGGAVVGFVIPSGGWRNVYTQ